MKTLLTLVALLISGTVIAGKYCDQFQFGGYAGNHDISANKVIQIISAPLVAIDSCNNKITNRSGQLFIYNKRDELVTTIQFSGALNPTQRRNVLAMIKPGYKFHFGEMRFGEENKFTPDVIFNIK